MGNSKITLIMLTMMLLVSSMAFADNINKDCIDAGFDFGIAKYNWDEITPVFDGGTDGIITFSNIIQKEANDGPEQYDWDSTESIAGIISKEGNNEYPANGGFSGTIVIYGQQAASHVVFCGNEPDEDVPEFGTIAGLAVLAGAGLFIYRRRK